MAKNIVEKVLEKHLISGEYKIGNEIGIRIDQTLTQDATGTMAYLQFEAMGIPKVKTDVSVSYVDHNTLQEGFENADDHRYLQTVASKYGIKYSRAGNGICHQVHVERFGKPGSTLLGSDSHTPTGGGIGQIAIGAGGIDVAVAMGGGAFYLTCPKVVNVELSGKLNSWVAAKDIILTLLKKLTTKGNVNTVVEYSGTGVKTLSVPERATITNMGAELGVTTSIFPSDATTKKFLLAQGRVGDWSELKADKSAKYSKTIKIDLSKVISMVACPHSPDNIKTVKSFKGKIVDQVCIGSCTNGSYRDLMLTAKLLKGKKIHPDVSVAIAPGSKQVFNMIAANGALADIIASGARIMESACGFCIGNGQAPKTGAFSVRTNNRNFEGRSGTKSAGIYLVSTETAIACAITGKMTDPSVLGKTYPKIAIPKEFLIDDSMIIDPAKKGSSVKVYRGPNIGNPPKNEELKDDLSGNVMIKVEDKITTDHIMPAGNRLKYRSNVPKYSNYVFEQVDSKFHDNCLENKDSGNMNFILAGESYGQGSSREHAALCPMYLGVKAVIAKSMERIHTANLINFGIVPLTFKNISDYNKIDFKDELFISDIKKALLENSTVNVVNKTKNNKFELEFSLSDRQKEIIFAGGLLNYTGNKK